MHPAQLHVDQKAGGGQAGKLKMFPSYEQNFSHFHQLLYGCLIPDPQAGVFDGHAPGAESFASTSRTEPRTDNSTALEIPPPPSGDFTSMRLHSCIRVVGLDMSIAASLHCVVAQPKGRVQAFSDSAIVHLRRAVHPDPSVVVRG